MPRCSGSSPWAGRGRGPGALARATARKLEQARRRGEVPQSRDVTTFGLYVGLLVALQGSQAGWRSTSARRCCPSWSSRISCSRCRRRRALIGLTAGASLDVLAGIAPLPAPAGPGRGPGPDRAAGVRVRWRATASEMESPVRDRQRPAAVRPKGAGGVCQDPAQAARRDRRGRPWWSGRASTRSWCWPAAMPACSARACSR